MRSLDTVPLNRILVLFFCCLFAAFPSFALEKWTNSIGMEFVKIPWDRYMRGSPAECGICEDDEKPQTRIEISSFWMGVYEVTQAQWEAVMGNNPSKFKGRNNPVEQVSWHDAQEFVRRLNAKEGHNRYRLPTEAEWEYAARAGSTTAYSFGDEADKLGDYAWYGGNSGGKTHPVGQKRPNAWGLYDMHGNVWEWVQDWYSKDYYSVAVPKEGQRLRGLTVDPEGWPVGEKRVLRGGSWYFRARFCRVAYRFYATPDDRSHARGFRLALTPER